jgi:hypothetical protein
MSTKDNRLMLDIVKSIIDMLKLLMIENIWWLYRILFANCARCCYNLGPVAGSWLIYCCLSCSCYCFCSYPRDHWYILIIWCGAFIYSLFLWLIAPFFPTLLLSYVVMIIDVICCWLCCAVTFLADWLFKCFLSYNSL